MATGRNGADLCFEVLFSFGTRRTKKQVNWKSNIPNEVGMYSHATEYISDLCGDTMEERTSNKKANTFYRAFFKKLKDERGYTYIELTISLSLLIILFPAVFFLSHTLEAEFRKLMSREELQMEYRIFHASLASEIAQATRLSLEGKNLVLDFPTGESARYEFKKRQLIRSVRRPGDMVFRGVTIVLQHVYFSTLVPDENGVYVDVGLQNWYSHLDLSTYIGKRVNV